VKLNNSFLEAQYVFVPVRSGANKVDANAFSVEGNGSLDSIQFIADSGCTEHVVNKYRYLNTCESAATGQKIKGANKDMKADLNVEYTGKIIAKGRRGKIIKLNNVLCTRNISRNLFSLRKLINKGAEVTLKRSGIDIIDEKTREKIKTGPYDGRFWWLNFDLVNSSKMKKVRKQVAALYNEKDNKNTMVSKNEGGKRMVNETEMGGSESAMNEPT